LKCLAATNPRSSSACARSPRIANPRPNSPRKLLTLTKNGHRFLTDTQSAGKGQVLYHGFTKPREANHDADLYRLYQKAAEKIEGQGGRNLRVVLDYEMKKRLDRDLAKRGPGRVPSKEISLPNGMGFRWFEERFQFPTFGSNRKRATARGPVWTSNLAPVTTGEEIWRKKSASDSPSTPTRRMLRNSGACWISGN